jgi:conjugal transfer pilin signal peptidase TrbI
MKTSLRAYFAGRRSLSLWQWLAIVFLGAAAAFSVHKYLRIGINISGSLKSRVFVVVIDRMPTARGEYVVFKTEGEGGAYPKGSLFTKLIAGIPGDQVEVSDQRVVSVHGTPIGIALQRAANGMSLEPIDPGVVPPGHLFVAGQSERSFDSRYKLMGMIPNERVVGTAYAVF